MLCQSCSSRKKCEKVCKEVESHLKSKRNYKTTYVNKEIGISEVSLDHGSVQEWLKSKQNHQRNRYHETWMEVVEVIESKLTERQREIVWMFLDGKSMNKIGKQLNISCQAVQYSLFGHPKHGGGAAKRIRSELAPTCQ